MTTKTAVATPKAPKAVGPYSQAVVANNFVFAAGQLGIDPRTGAFAGHTAAAQAEQALINLGNVLEAAGSSLADAVAITVYLADLADFDAVNAVYARYVSTPFPARVCIQAAALPKNARVEISAIAAVV